MGTSENVLLNAMSAQDDNTDGGKHSVKWLEYLGLRPRPDAIGCGDRERHPGHVCTHRGIMFDLIQPQAAAVFPDDVAHSLALQCRFTGHAPYHYSIAQHSLACAEMCYREYPGRPDLQLYCLLHDGAEAYCGDVSRPLKSLIRPCYKPIEDRVQNVVWERFGLAVELTAEVADVIHTFDQSQVMAEARDMFAGSEGWNWGSTAPSPVVTEETPWRDVKWHFQQTFSELYARYTGNFWKD